MIVKEEINANCIDIAECGCRIWMGRLNDSGYGVIARSRKSSHRSDQRVHRIMWALEFGPIPEGLLILHRCDVRSCVNPNHLFLGTQRENMADMWSKGRGKIPNVRGERQGSAKLDANAVRAIRLLDGAMPRKQIAALFKVDVTNVGLICRREGWKHVD